MVIERPQGTTIIFSVSGVFSYRDPAAVRKFLTNHEELLAARVVREVGNKLNTGLKNPR